MQQGTNEQETKGQVILGQDKVEEIAKKIINLASNNEGENLEKVLEASDITKEFKTLSQNDKKAVFLQILKQTRSDLDYGYESQSCEIVSKLAVDVAQETKIPEEDLQRLNFVSSFYKAEMFLALSGVPNIDEKGTILFDRAALLKSKSRFETIVKVLLGQEYEKILKRNGPLGQILFVADSYNAMTNLGNPAKYAPNKQNVVTFNGKEYKVECQNDTYTVTTETNQQIKISRPALVMSIEDAFKDLESKSFYDKNVITALGKVTQPELAQEIHEKEIQRQQLAQQQLEREEARLDQEQLEREQQQLAQEIEPAPNNERFMGWLWRILVGIFHFMTFGAFKSQTVNVEPDDHEFGDDAASECHTESCSQDVQSRLEVGQQIGRSTMTLPVNNCPSRGCQSSSLTAVLPASQQGPEVSSAPQHTQTNP